MISIEDLLGRLKGVEPAFHTKPEGPWTAFCPSHNDQYKRSLSVAVTPNRFLLRCFAGCKVIEQIVPALQIRPADLFNLNGQPPAGDKRADRRIVATYAYEDERGTLLYQVVRYEPKDFRPRRPDGTGGWIWDLKDVRRVVYRLPELAEQRRVVWVEGEKDVDRLWSLHIAATTSPSGASSWRDEYAEQIRAAGVEEVVSIPDHDAPGRAYAAKVATALQRLGSRVRLLALPGLAEHGDVSDWLDAGHEASELRRLLDQAPSFTARGGQSEAPSVPPSIAPSAPLRLPGGFIGRYVEAALQRTDAPAEAHALTAVGVLSALAGPRVRLPLAYRSDGVRLGIWTMNVVDSTSGRKSTVLEFGIDVLRQVLGELAILPWKGSPEALIQAMAARDHATSVFARDEYSGLLAQMKKGGYTAGLAQDFIRAYDGLPIIMARTAKMNRKSGERMDDTDRVKEPYLVKLCAATRTAFIETATIEDVLDGLLARFVFTSGSAEERRAQPMTSAIEEAWRAVVDLARDFHDRAGELLHVTLPDAVLDQAWELERRYKDAALEHPRPDAARPAMKRLAETVLKVAALLAIDRAREGSATVTPEDFEAAVALGECWQATTLALIADIGRSRFQARSDKVLATIRAKPKGLMLSALYRAHRDLQGREFDDVLDALERQRLVHSVEVKVPGKTGRPPVMYFPGPPADES
jgi:hypothetical protein